MGGTGLEPVTPSLSNIFGDGDVPHASPLFAAQKDFMFRSLAWSCGAVRIVCAFIVRRRCAAWLSDETTPDSIPLFSRERPAVLGGSKAP
jgi:hypothetical protein